MTEIILSIGLLIFLEIIFNSDNLIAISFFVSNIDDIKLRHRARYTGLIFALFIRLFMIFFMLSLFTSNTYVYGFNVRNIMHIIGGLYLLYAGSKEFIRFNHKDKKCNSKGFWIVVSNVIFLDIIFSVDSILTAIALSNSLYMIYIAVIVTFLILLMFSKKLSDWIVTYKWVKTFAVLFIIGLGIKLLYTGLFS